MHRCALYDNLPPLNSLRAFEAAGRHLSFTKAAVELGVTQGAVSYQIRQLEGRLGIKLFERRIRQVALTVQGERLLAVTRRAFLDLSGEIGTLIAPRDDGTLTVAVSTYVTTRWLSRHLNAFLRKHPETNLNLQHSVNAPDFEVGNVDFIIWWGKAPWPGFQARVLLQMPMVPVCSPELLEGANPIREPSDLGQHVLLRDQKNVDLWPEWLKKAGVPEDAVGPGQTISDPNVRIQAAIDGQGVVLADDLVSDERVFGKLVAPFDIALDGYGYYLMWPRDKPERTVSLAFAEWLASLSP